ncbi:MAG: helix-turn-helix domain-containing protein [bacterium]|nr:helix-turn-helix domain-containing protein [bacterium]
MASIGDDLPELMTIQEVADFLRVSKITLKRWGKRGKLQAIRINQRGDRRYKKEAVLWLVGEMYKKDATTPAANTSQHSTTEEQQVMLDDSSE